MNLLRRSEHLNYGAKLLAGGRAREPRWTLMAPSSKQQQHERKLNIPNFPSQVSGRGRKDLVHTNFSVTKF